VGEFISKSGKSMDLQQEFWQVNTGDKFVQEQQKLKEQK
jgi:hypothetical protein